MEIPGVNEKGSGISRGDCGSSFLALEFPRDVTQFCKIRLFSFSSVGFCSVKHMVLQQKFGHGM